MRVQHPADRRAFTGDGPRSRAKRGTVALGREQVRLAQQFVAQEQLGVRPVMRRSSTIRSARYVSGVSSGVGRRNRTDSSAVLPARPRRAVELLEHAVEEHGEEPSVHDAPVVPRS